MHHGGPVDTHVLAAHRRRRRFHEPHVREVGEGQDGQLLNHRVLEVLNDPLGVNATQSRPVGNDQGDRRPPLRVGDDSGAPSAWRASPNLVA